MTPAAAALPDHLRHDIQQAIQAVKRILDETRQPAFFGQVDHTFQDKYALVEYTINMGLASQINTLEAIVGKDAFGNKFQELLKISDNGTRTVTLRFEAKESSSFLKEEEVEVGETMGKLTSTTVETASGTSSESKKTSTTTFTTTTRHFHWRLRADYAVKAFVGSNANEHNVTLLEGSFGGDIVQQGVKSTPKSVFHGPIDVAITHLFQLVDSNQQCHFAIDRTDSKKCKTPLNNPNVRQVQETIEVMSEWSQRVVHALRRYLDSLPQPPVAPSCQPTERVVCGTSHGVGYTPLSQDFDRILSNAAADLFVPVNMLFDAKRSNEASDDAPPKESSVGQLPAEANYFSAPVLSASDTALLLDEERRTLLEVKTKLTNFEKDAKGGSSFMLGVPELNLCVLVRHIEMVLRHVAQGLYSVEEDLERQLVAAIGQHVGPREFAEYMAFHNKRLLREPYAPAPFCFAVRRPNHSPEGTVSLVSSDEFAMDGKSGGNDILDTLHRKLPVEAVAAPLQVKLNAATTVEIVGDRYAHVILAHEFGGQDDVSLALVARARQFSGFMLILGTLTGPNSLDPTAAIILQNKDEIKIPLILSQLPSAKEFQQAISSLSPEQQRFSKAFRNMQLSSSVFGVLIVQVKPQLELLLGLPPDALTKEMKLTQSLLELFIEYQIPSDLLTFDGAASASVEDKVARVKHHVAGVEEIIDAAKKKSLAEEEKKAELRFAKAQAPPQLGVRMMRRGAPQEMPPIATFGAAPQMNIPMHSASATDHNVDLSEVEDGWEEEGGFGGARMFGDDEMEAEEDARSNQEPKGEIPQEIGDLDVLVDGSDFDLSSLPKRMDTRFEQLDTDSALHPTKIKSGPIWTKRFKPNLLAPEESTKLHAAEQEREQNNAFDLLDALSRSGSLPISDGELHVMVAATHSFDKSLIHTVIEDNVNPIEKLERSVLIVASTLHGNAKVTDLLVQDKKEHTRILGQSPMLLTS